MKRVLIIEDDDNNFVLIADLLQNAGYQPVAATTGEQGVQMALSDPPDFILLDIQLPDIDGYQVLDRIRSSANGATVPVIAVTSYAMSGDREKLLAAGCNGYIEKPIDPDTVIDSIREVVEPRA